MIAKQCLHGQKVTFEENQNVQEDKKISGENKLSKSTLKSICFLWQSEMNETGAQFVTN